MANIIGAVVLLAVVGIAAGYIIRAKRRGAKCIGCPYCKSCASARNGQGCSCGDE